MGFVAIADDLLFSKNDPQDPRLGESVVRATPASAIPHPWALCGYPDDEGIQLNGGRPGAALAPDRIRKFLYRMTPPVFDPDGSNVIGDFGNIRTNVTLAERHNLARKFVFERLQRNQKVITLGGGHDYGFGDTAGFMDWAMANSFGKALVLNFDAHLDVRPTNKGLHSGTPFRRLLEEFKGRLDFFELGLQPQCNSPHHRQWAQDNGATLIDLDKIEQLGLSEVLKDALEPDKNRPMWISLDMDAFSSAFAPGCSQSFATGLTPSQFLPALRHLQMNFNVVGLSIYEVSPTLDTDDQTSKLAAIIAHRFLWSHKTQDFT